MALLFISGLEILPRFLPLFSGLIQYSPCQKISLKFQQKSQKFWNRPGYIDNVSKGVIMDNPADNYRYAYKHYYYGRSNGNGSV